jgi:TonB-dependent SusC/RagA subfamily outer membrane receptor
LSLLKPEDPENLNIRVMASPGLINGEEITVIAQSNNVIQYVSKANVDASAFNGKIPKDRLSSGIVHLTLFSSKFQPVAERLVFINRNDHLTINISTDKEQYTTREKVKMDLDVKDLEGKPVQGSFSIAVTDANKVPFDDNKGLTIFSNLLLTSDLPGYIENPNYYFTETNADKMRQLDNLMLTQGWRKFSWKSLIADQYPSIAFGPEKSIEIRGRVTEPNGKPVKGGKVSLLSTSGDGFALDTITDNDGNFRFSDLNFISTTNFVVQAYNAKGRKNVDIDIYQIPPQMVTPTKNTPDAQVDVNNSIITYLKNSKDRFDVLKKLGLGKRNIILAEVKVVEKKPAVKYSSNLNGAGNADQIIKSDDLKNCLTLIQCLEGRLVGVMFRNGIPISTRGGVMNVMVDGIFSAPDYLNIIHPNDVESIEVLRNAGYLSIYGLRGGNGIIMINTKRGERNLSSGRYARGLASFSPQGYYLGREFYSPKYIPGEDSGRSIPDMRTTIYWKPNIITDSTGKAEIEFYSASLPTTYKAIVEGLDVSGKLGRYVLQFEVR